MPIRRRCGGTLMSREDENTQSSAISISPASGVSRPATQRRIVLLPQPLGPSSVKNDWPSTLKPTLSSARTGRRPRETAWRDRGPGSCVGPEAPAKPARDDGDRGDNGHDHRHVRGQDVRIAALPHVEDENREHFGARRGEEYRRRIFAKRAQRHVEHRRKQAWHGQAENDPRIRTIHPAPATAPASSSSGCSCDNPERQMRTANGKWIAM